MAGKFATAHHNGSGGGNKNFVSGVAAMFADGKANWFAIFGKRSSIDDEIDGGLRLITAPESNLIVDEINARAAIADLVGTNDFLELDANARSGVWHGQIDQSGIFFKPAPVAFKSESFAAHDAQRGEESPTVDEAGLSGGQADFFDGKQLGVMKNVTIDQRMRLAENGTGSIVAERRGGRGG